jgi:hypothetical protein
VVVFVRKTTVNFFKTLFRVIISPNAPWISNHLGIEA